MKVATRKILPIPIVQGQNESISYELDTLPWGGVPTNPVAILTESGMDVTGTKMPGSVTIVGDHIILPPITGLEPGVHYRLTIRFNSGGNVFETYNVVIGEE